MRTASGVRVRAGISSVSRRIFRSSGSTSQAGNVMKSAGNRGIVVRLSRRVRNVVTLGGRRTRRKLVTCLALIAMLVQLTPWRGGAVALAADTWRGTADGNWDTAGNWTTGVPNAGSDAVF